MYCANCRTEIASSSGYCPRCGVPFEKRLCPNGHIMDPAWTECRYCGAASAAPPGSKGRTVIEAPGGVPAGGFVKGATLLEGAGAVRPPGRTLHEGLAAGKGHTVAEGPADRTKARTVYDPGAASAPVAAPRTLPRLVGWLVTFSNLQSGEDYRLRDGRNTVGADSSECDIVVASDSSLSGKHAVIICREGTIQIRDNDSTNGTYVNGEDIFGKGSVALKNLDAVRFGRTECVLYTLRQG